MSDLLTLIIPGYFQDYLCTILMCFANSVFTLGKGRVKKEIVEFGSGTLERFPPHTKIENNIKCVLKQL